MMKGWWIEYTDGTRKIFQAADYSSAHHYFMMEGRHALDFGLVKNWGEYFKTEWDGNEDNIELTRSKRVGGRGHYEIDTDD